MGWLFYTDRRVQSYADEKAEITRLCTFETDTRRTTLVKASKVGSTWYAAAKVESLDGTSLEDRQIVTATHYRRGRQKRRCYRIEETGSLVRLSKASLARSELISREIAEGSAVLVEFFAGQGA